MEKFNKICNYDALKYDEIIKISKLNVNSYDYFCSKIDLQTNLDFEIINGWNLPILDLNKFTNFVSIPIEINKHNISAIDSINACCEIEIITNHNNRIDINYKSSDYIYNLSKLNPDHDTKKRSLQNESFYFKHIIIGIHNNNMKMLTTKNEKIIKIMQYATTILMHPDKCPYVHIDLLYLEKNPLICRIDKYHNLTFGSLFDDFVHQNIYEYILILEKWYAIYNCKKNIKKFMLGTSNANKKSLVKMLPNEIIEKIVIKTLNAQKSDEKISNNLRKKFRINDVLNYEKKYFLSKSFLNKTWLICCYVDDLCNKK